MKKSKLRAFLRGVGSVMEIYPQASPRTFYSLKDFKASSSDKSALKSDWERVLKDIEAVTKEN